ncbi:MAG: hypothetical protein EOP35_16605, partial [Rubrivivax sp.]
MRATAGRDIAVYGTVISAQAAGQRLLLQAEGAINIGSVGGHSGGAVLEANALLGLLAGSRLTLAIDAQLYSTGDASLVSVQAPQVTLAGTVRAGGDYISAGVWNFTGKNAQLQVSALREIVVGDLATNSGGELTATGRLTLQSGANAAGIGMLFTDTALVRSDASGGGKWSDSVKGEAGLVRLVSDGDIRLKGLVSAVDNDADVGIVSRSQVLVGGIVRADDRLEIVAGTDDSKTGIRVAQLVRNATTQAYVSGGQLETALGGSIILTSIDDVRVDGAVGTAVANIGDGITSLVDIASVSGDVVILRDINALNTVLITGGNLLAQAGSRVHASATGSTVYMAARNSIVVSPGPTTPTFFSDAAIVQAGSLIHFAAPTVQIDGFVQTTDRTGSSRILVSAGRSASFGGTVTSGITATNGGVTSIGHIEVHAGVDLTTRDRASLEGTVLKSELLGGSISILGQGLLRATGHLTLMAGGDITLDADADLNADRDITTQVVTLVAEKVTRVTGYTKVATGTVTVPEITYQDTVITEQVGTELVPVGSSYTTMNAVIEQVGYYNASTGEFRETFVEGVDYLNQAITGSTIPVVNWSNGSDEQHPGRAATSPPSGNYKDTAYQEFQQLDDAEHWAVLNTLGFKPLYQFSYSNPQLHEVKNGVPHVYSPGQGGYTGPAWAGKPEKVYFVDVANWRDKFVLMPQGAQEDILALVSQGQTQYLTGDNNKDGNNGVGASGSTSAWTTVSGGASGEYVGTVKEQARVLYSQSKSAFTSLYIFNLDDDGSGAKWNVSYRDSGQRIFNFVNSAVPGASAPITATQTNREPGWNVTTGGTGATLDFYSPNRGADDITAANAYIAQLSDATFSNASAQDMGSRVVGGSMFSPFSFTLYEHGNYGGRAYQFNNSVGGPWNGDIRNTPDPLYASIPFFTIRYPHDNASSVSFGGDLYQLTLYRDVGPAGITSTYKYNNYTDNTANLMFHSSWLGGADIGNDTVSAYAAWGKVYENFYNYTYTWTGADKPVFDQRERHQYLLTTQSHDIVESRPVYQTTVSKVPVQTDHLVTVWKDVPIVSEETVFRSVVSTATVSAGLNGSLASISGGSVMIDAGNTVRLSGHVTAVDTLNIKGENEVALRGLTHAGASRQLAVELDGNAIDVHAGVTLRMDDSTIITGTRTGTQALATVTLSSDGDLLFAGTVQPGATGALGAVTLQAQGDVRMSGGITAGSIVIEAGHGGALSGSVVTDDDTRLTAAGGDIGISAGDAAGSVLLNSSLIVADGTVTLSAASGQILQSATGNGNGGVAIGGEIHAQTLNADAEAGIVLATQVAHIGHATLTGEGNVELINKGDLLLDYAQAMDGFVQVRVTGSLTAAEVYARGASDRNDISLRAYQPAAIADPLNRPRVNLSVGRVMAGSDAGNASLDRGDVVLESVGDVTALDANSLVTGETLTVIAGAKGSVSSVQLKTAVF